MPPKKKQTKEELTEDDFDDSILGFASKVLPLPTETRIKAIGKTPNPELQILIDQDLSAWADLPIPRHPDDWLYQFCEPRQSYDAWLKSSHPSHLYFKEKKPARKIIYLQQVGNDPNLDMEQLATFFEKYYPGIKTKVLPCIDLKKGTNNTYSIEYVTQTQSQRKKSKTLISRRCHRYDEAVMPKDHVQFAIDPLLNCMSDLLPQDGLALLGVTMEDLYEGKTDSFCCGMANGGSQVGLFSFARYNPQFPLRKMNQTDQSLLLLRSCRTAVHEVAHCFGIGHCVYFDCCMGGSGHLQQDFAFPIHLCPVDLAKLIKFCNASVSDRYKGLAEFYQAHAWREEYSWVANRLKTLEDHPIPVENTTKEKKTKTVISKIEKPKTEKTKIEKTKIEKTKIEKIKTEKTKVEKIKTEKIKTKKSIEPSKRKSQTKKATEKKLKTEEI